jgi:hypothetical protein
VYARNPPFTVITRSSTGMTPATVLHASFPMAAMKHVASLPAEFVIGRCYGESAAFDTVTSGASYMWNQVAGSSRSHKPV